MKDKKMHSFRYRMTLSCVLLTIVPLFLMSTLQYYFSQYKMNTQNENYLRNMVEWTTSKVDDFAHEITQMTISLICNSTIQSGLKKANQGGMTRVEAYRLAEDMKDSMESFALLKSFFSGIQIYSDSGVCYQYSTLKNVLDFEITKEEVYADKGKLRWHFEPEENRVVAARKISSLDGGESLGYMLVYLQTDWVESYLNLKDSQDGILLYVLNGEDEGFLFGGNTELPENLETEKLILHGSNDYYLGKSCGDGWHVLAVISVKTMHAESVWLRNMYYLIAGIAAVLIMLALIWYLRRITRPLADLTEQMRLVGHGDFTVRNSVSTDDEFGLLGRTFNKMVMRIDGLLHEVYEQQLLKQKAEMESLQMQINPHFLYNTLDAMNWMARMRGVKEVGEIAVALGSLMRYALGKTVEVKLSAEAEQLEGYMKIQSYRYGDRLTTEIRIPEELADCIVPKLIIQPILENAIVHGLEERMENAHAEVEATRVDDDLWISVRDNGVGMTEEQIRQVFAGETASAKKNHTSVGILNVHRRLKLRYGEGYGLTVESRPGVGTVVRMRLKIERQEEEAPEKESEGQKRDSKIGMAESR